MSLQQVEGVVIALQLEAARALGWNTAIKAPATIQRLELNFECRINHEENLQASAKALCFALRHDVIVHLCQGQGSARSCGGSQKGRQGLTSHPQPRHPSIPDASFASQAADLHQQCALLSLPDVVSHLSAA